MGLFVGVDAGGSKTVAVVVNERGDVLGSGGGSGANYQVCGIPEALVNIRRAIEEALLIAGVSFEDVDFAQFALAGADRPNDHAALRPALADIPFPRWELTCDTVAGLRSGTTDNVGVVLVCGSGTNAYGRNRAGRTVQTGGFGYLYGDRTGGTELAREAFSAAVRSWERREAESLLTSLVPRYFGFPTMESLVNEFLDRGITEVPGELAMVLPEAADHGDELAVRILATAGRELGLAANSVILRLGGFGTMKVPIVLVGSVLQRGRNRVLLGALEQTIASRNHPHELVIPRMAPVFGAVLLALDACGIPAGPELYEHLNATGGIAP